MPPRSRWTPQAAHTSPAPQIPQTFRTRLERFRPASGAAMRLSQRSILRALHSLTPPSSVAVGPISAMASPSIREGMPTSPAALAHPIFLSHRAPTRPVLPATAMLS